MIIWQALTWFSEFWVNFWWQVSGKGKVAKLKVTEQLQRYGFLVLLFAAPDELPHSFHRLVTFLSRLIFSVTVAVHTVIWRRTVRSSQSRMNITRRSCHTSSFLSVRRPESLLIVNLGPSHGWGKSSPAQTVDSQIWIAITRLTRTQSETSGVWMQTSDSTSRPLLESSSVETVACLRLAAVWSSRQETW